MKKNKVIIYGLFLLLALSLAGNIFFYAAKENMAEQKKGLEIKIDQLVMDNKNLALAEKGTLKDNKILELDIERLKEEAAVIDIRLKEEIDKLSQALLNITAKDEEISRLNNESAARGQKIQVLEEELLSLGAAYEKLLSNFNAVFAQKKKYEKKLNNFIEIMADEQAITSLGTVVISH